MDPEELFKAMRTRTTVRKYTDEGIEKQKLGKILEAARWAPSPGNVQSWEFIIVEDYDKKEKLSQYAYNQEHVREAPACIVVLGDEEKVADKYGERGKNLYVVQETAAAMQNMLLMASSLGIGSAWVGAFEEEKVKDLLDIHKRLRPFAIITLGHPKERPEQPNKHRITDVTYMNEYGNKTHALYDKVVWEGMKEYSRRAKNKVKEKLKD